MDDYLKIPTQWPEDIVKILYIFYNVQLVKYTHYKQISILILKSNQVILLVGMVSLKVLDQTLYLLII